jgi:hypothetical protein
MSKPFAKNFEQRDADTSQRMTVHVGEELA